MIRIWAGAVLALIATALMAWGAAAQSVGYTQQMRDRFQTECTQSGAAATHCVCVWNGVRAEMSAVSFSALDNAFRTQQLHPLMAKYELIVGECNGTNRATAASPEAYPGHISTNFNEGCVSGGVSAAICGCAMGRFERELPLQTFVELDHMSRWGRDSEHPEYQRFVDIIRSCVQANPPGN